jgi:hypothetical protein
VGFLSTPKLAALVETTKKVNEIDREDRIIERGVRDFRECAPHGGDPCASWKQRQVG